MKMNNTFSLFAISLLYLLLGIFWMWLFNTSLEFISAPSNVQVVLGLVGVLICLFTLAFAGSHVYRHVLDK